MIFELARGRKFGGESQSTLLNNAILETTKSRKMLNFLVYPAEFDRTVMLRKATC